MARPLNYGARRTRKDDPILPLSCLILHEARRGPNVAPAKKVRIGHMKTDTLRETPRSFDGVLERHSPAPQAELATLIERFTPRDGAHPTTLAALHLFRFSAPGGPAHYVYEPTLCLIAQGSKRVMLADELYRYDPAHFLLTTVDLPVVTQIIEATPQAPYLSLSLDIDIGQLGALIAKMKPPAAPAKAQSGRGIAVGCLDAPLLDAFVRLLRLLDSPQHIEVLAPLIMREILYLLLMGEQGAKLRRIAFQRGERKGIAEAIHWLKGHFAEPLRIEEIARKVHLSPSGLHHGFKAVTAMSPLQYQKQLRLQEARRLMLGDCLDAHTASLRVGYESASQFSREYHRLFGDSPRRDIVRLRGSGQ